MTGSDMEKKSIHGDEEKMQHDFIEQSALAGHVATDSKGHSLITFDPAAEAKLRRKVGFFFFFPLPEIPKAQ